MDIRLAKKEDIVELAEVYQLAYNSLNIGENWNQETSIKLIKYFFDLQPDLFFVAELDDKVVGGLVAQIKPWWDGNHLVEGELFVHPDHQSKGLGKKLIKKLFSEAKEKYGAISWDTFTHRVYEHPLKWYKNMGFEEIANWVMITGDVKKVLKNLKEA